MEIEIGSKPPGLTKRMDQETIDAWADISGDHNPLHVDPVFAATTRFRGTIAHGHIALGWLCELMLAWRGPNWLMGGSLTGVAFRHPVRPGQSFEVVGRVIGNDSDRGAEVRVEVYESDSGTLCVEGTAWMPSVTKEDADTRR